MKKLIATLLLASLLLGMTVTASAQDTESQDTYTLDRIVILSRHNIRSPLSGSGSLLGDITPHEWFEWTSKPSELSLRGALLETLMGQYFRLWLEDEGFFPENYQPEGGAVRFYANSMQRTLATARYFSAGLLPVAKVEIENHAAYDTMDPTFRPALNFVNDAYAEDVRERKQLFKQVEKTSDGLDITFVTTFGVADGVNKDVVDSEVVAEDLFR